MPKGLGVAVGAGTLVGVGTGCLVGTAVGAGAVAVGCDTALAGVDVGVTAFSSDPDEHCASVGPSDESACGETPYRTRVQLNAPFY